jgi:hypothetical protein
MLEVAKSEIILIGFVRGTQEKRSVVLEFTSLLVLTM